MADYQLTQTDSTIYRTADGAFIPVDDGNSDYQDYQSWLGDGNTPDAAPVPYVAPTITLSSLQQQLSDLTAQLAAFQSGGT